MRIQKMGLRLEAGKNVEIVDPEDDVRFTESWTEYYRLKGRDGITPTIAKAMVRKHNTLIAVLLLKRGDADAVLCGITSRFDNQLKYVEDVIGMQPGASTFATTAASVPLCVCCCLCYRIQLRCILNLNASVWFCCRVMRLMTVGEVSRFWL